MNVPLSHPTGEQQHNAAQASPPLSGLAKDSHQQTKLKGQS